MYHEIKDQLRLLINTQFPEDEICLLLSGGSDSTVVGLVANELGKKVHSISFQLEGQCSWDFQTAKNTSVQLGWTFHEVIVPSGNPKDDFFNLIHKHKCKKKTDILLKITSISKPIPVVDLRTTKKSSIAINKKIGKNLTKSSNLSTLKK